MRKTRTGIRPGKYHIAIVTELLLIAILISGNFVNQEEAASVSGNLKIAQKNTAEGSLDYIKWVDFTVTCEALDFAYEQDVNAHAAGTHLDWVTLLAYTSAKWGGEFGKKAMKEMAEIAQKALEKADDQKTATQVIEEAGSDLKYFPYYREAYSAILSGMVGAYEAQIQDDDGNVSWQSCYGLKAYSPIAKGFDYSDYDDFGVSRSYGYSRAHLGHDMMGQIGTPIRIKN